LKEILTNDLAKGSLQTEWNKNDSTTLAIKELAALNAQA